MSYKASVIEVMIASPSDVPQERRLAREAILDWNSINARHLQIVLMPTGWETHSTPDTGNSPQSIINGQVLKHADLLIAVFWTRLGTSTGVAASGTVEEIEEHIKAGKPAMIYFSSAPVQPDSIDQDQYAALTEFKKSLGSQSLYQVYDNPIDFEAKLKRHLAQKIIERFLDGKVTPDLAASSLIGPPPLLLPNPNSSSAQLLIEASKDEQGVIMHLRMLNGLHVQTNGRNFVELHNPRSEATWRGAVEELLTLGLIEDRGSKGEILRMTASGYAMAERLSRD